VAWGSWPDLVLILRYNTPNKRWTPVKILRGFDRETLYFKASRLWLSEPSYVCGWSCAFLDTPGPVWVPIAKKNLNALQWLVTREYPGTQAGR